MRRLLLCIAGAGVLSAGVACDSDHSRDSGAGGTGGIGSAATGGGAGSAGSGGTAGTAGAGTGGTSGSDSGGSSGTAGDAGSGGAPPGDAGAMSFFVSSTPVSSTGNLGGIDGADQHCRTLAQAAGSTKTQWFAYLSVESGGSGSPVHAKDRIGTGPWYNAAGQLFADSVAALHPTIDATVDREAYIAAKPADALFLDETGASVPRAEHDILTGSNLDGTVYTGRTCNDWTSAETTAIAQVGHSDTPESFSPSWNSAHDAESCSQAGLVARLGSGRIYCFATD